MTEQVFSAAERRRSLSAVIMSSAAIGVHFGVMIPAVTLTLESWGVRPTVIGLNAAMQPLALLLFSAFLPRIIGRLGALPCLFGGLVVATAAALLMPLLPNLTAWFVFRFLMGLGMALPWLVGETWINIVAAPESRGRVVALYGIAFFGGLAVGPLVLQAVGGTGWPPFLAAAGAVVVAALPFAVYARLAPAMPAVPEIRFLQAAAVAPLMIGAAVIAGITEVATYAMLPLYGLRNGLGEAASVTLLTVFTLGALALQWPLGALADRFGARRLLLASAAAGIGLCLLLPPAMATPLLLWPLIFAWGGVTLAFYTLGLAHLGHRFPRAQLAVANAVFIVGFEAGNVAGPSLAGAAMEIWDPHGLPGFLAAALAVFLAIGLLRRPPRDTG
ncbi:MAG: MFS transporter [Alphaproteobacteria bacterium]|nr:MFS transporter [Alphaproteobacteria bacterium]